jgi:hypothetical protein
MGINTETTKSAEPIIVSPVSEEPSATLPPASDKPPTPSPQPTPSKSAMPSPTSFWPTTPSLQQTPPASTEQQQQQQPDPAAPIIKVKKTTSRKSIGSDGSTQITHGDLAQESLKLRYNLL